MAAVVVVVVKSVVSVFAAVAEAVAPAEDADTVSETVLILACSGAPGLLQRVNEVKTTAASMTKREVIMATLKLCSCFKKWNFQMRCPTG
ncbi:MAG: hypothetical protein EA364_01020 [Balneolaceae bacterium]|nr:MAG: hypothetical protein EA364_01020 [Balneolaceae bacterium]